MLDWSLWPTVALFNSFATMDHLWLAHNVCQWHYVSLWPSWGSAMTTAWHGNHSTWLSSARENSRGDTRMEEGVGGGNVKGLQWPAVQHLMAYIREMGKCPLGRNFLCWRCASFKQWVLSNKYESLAIRMQILSFRGLASTDSLT